LATKTIYQSKYSRHCTEKFFGRPHSQIQATIYNGVDTNHFTPDGPNQTLRDNPNQHLFITWSRFRRPDQIEPLILAIEKYRHSYQKNSKLVILGNFEGDVSNIPTKHQNKKYLSFLGSVPNELLPRYARSADIFIMSHQNPPCPNNVLEAMACGLPICGVADGAMKEITQPGENSELIPTEGEAFYKPRQLDISFFTANMNKIMNNLNHYSTTSRKLSLSKFQLNTMTERTSTSTLIRCQPHPVPRQWTIPSPLMGLVKSPITLLLARFVAYLTQGFPSIGHPMIKNLRH